VKQDDETRDKESERGVTATLAGDLYHHAGAANLNVTCQNHKSDLEGRVGPCRAYLN
jgi:hypothetical protein